MYKIAFNPLNTPRIRIRLDFVNVLSKIMNPPPCPIDNYINTKKLGLFEAKML